MGEVSLKDLGVSTGRDQFNSEISMDRTPAWEKWASKNVPQITEAVGAIAGGLMGAPWTLPSFGTAPVAGAGAGAVTGRMAGEGFNQLLGVPRTVPVNEAGTSELDRNLASAQRGMYGEMLGPLFGKAISAGGSLSRVPSTKELAGGVLQSAEKYDPLSADFIKTQERKLAGSAGRAGITEREIPFEMRPNPRAQALAQQRQSANIGLRSSVDAQERVVQTKADALIPKVNPQARDFVLKKLESASAAESAQIEAEATMAAQAKLAGKADLAAQKTALGESADAVKLSELGSEPYSKLTAGEQLRAEIGAGKTEVGKVFQRAYQDPKFNAPELVAATDDFAEALTNAKLASSDQGAVLKNYVNLSNAENRLSLANMLDDAEGAGIPPEMTLSQWRTVKGELRTAANDAARGQNFTAAKRLSDIAKLAEQGEAAAAAKLGDKEFLDYNTLTKAYDEQYHAAFREGMPRRTLQTQRGGSEGFTYTPERLVTQLEKPTAARELKLALGSKQAAASGKTLTGIDPTDVMVMGERQAAEIAEPYFRAKLANAYQKAGGGVAGAKKVASMLADNDLQVVLKEYGIADRFASTGEKLKRIANTTILPEVAEAESRTVVSGVLKIKDPDKLAAYILNHPDPRGAMSSVYAVSSDPMWRQSINDLTKAELKKRVDSGVDIFKDPKTRMVLPTMYSKSDIRALSDYATIIKNTAPARVGSKAEMELGGTAPHTAHQATTALPVGFGPLYFLKQVLKLNLSREALKAETEVLKFVDDALLNPARAKEFVDAFKGSKYGKRKLETEIDKYVRERTSTQARDRVLSNIAIERTRPVTDALTGNEEVVPEESNPDNIATETWNYWTGK